MISLSDDRIVDVQDMVAVILGWNRVGQPALLGCFPDPHGLVARRRRDPRPVRRERDGLHVLAVAAQRQELRTARDLPDPHRRVVPARDQAQPVGAVVDAVDGSLMPDQSADLLARDDVPDLDGAGRRSGGEVAAG